MTLCKSDSSLYKFLFGNCGNLIRRLNNAAKSLRLDFHSVSTIIPLASPPPMQIAAKPRFKPRCFRA